VLQNIVETVGVNTCLCSTSFRGGGVGGVWGTNYNENASL